jgi:formyltetrahydrofolate deformylase
MVANIERKQIISQQQSDSQVKEIDYFVMKLGMVHSLRTSEYNPLLAMSLLACPEIQQNLSSVSVTDKLDFSKTSTATLLLSCPEQTGLVAKLTNFISFNGGNILHANQHWDSQSGLFLTRIEWEFNDFQLSRPKITSAFTDIATSLKASWRLHFSETVPRIAIWVTKQDHCLLDLLWRWQAGEIKAEIPLIISNHQKLRRIAAQFGLDFYYIPITQEKKLEQEAQQLELLQQYRIDLVVLAKYMQILSPEFIARFPRIINIHHSFLPAFTGAKPYHQAYERGVKIIGATAHYVTENLDEGPIIEQDVIKINHRDTVADLIRQGKDLERIVLAKAVRVHLQNRVLVYGNRTVVFS